MAVPDEQPVVIDAGQGWRGTPALGGSGSYDPANERYVPNGRGGLMRVAVDELAQQTEDAVRRSLGLGRARRKSPGERARQRQVEKDLARWKDIVDRCS